MRYIILSLVLFAVGCGNTEETGTLDFAVALNAGQSPSCTGRMSLIMTQPARDSDVSIAGSWTCTGSGIGYSGDISGIWPAGERAAHLTLVTVPGETTTADLAIGWFVSGTARLEGIDVPVSATF